MDSNKLARYLDQSTNFNFGSGSGPIPKSVFSLPDSSPPARRHEEEDPDEEEEEDIEEAMEDYSEEEISQDFDPGLIGRVMDRNQADEKTSAFGASMNGGVEQAPAEVLSSLRTTSGANNTPENAKRSRLGAMVPHNSPRSKSTSRKIESRVSDNLSIARDLSKRLGAAPLEESDKLIIGTEECVSTLYATISDANDHPGALASALSGACERLDNLWNSCRDRDARKASWREEVVMGIGPDKNAPSAHSATFLSTLLLSLHHPAAAKGGQALAVSRRNPSSQKSTIPYSPDTPLNPTAYPKILLDWLEKNHNPYRAIISEVQTYRPNPTAHDFYWDIIYKLAIRGSFADLISMLKKAEFRHAHTAREDGQGNEGYRGVQLENINMVVGWGIQALQTCPALTDDDWHVSGNAWIIFRKRVEKAMDSLVNFAEGRDKDLDPEEPAFEASNFGLKLTSNDLSRSSRRAASRVPWAILQNLKTLYGILLGGSLEILSYSENWVEGTIALTVWWGGEDDEELAIGSLAMSRRSLKQSKSRGPRLVDTDSGLAYRRRMASAFERVTQDPEDSDDPPMLPDTGKALEVALSSIFDGDVTGAIGIIRAMSLPIANAVAEIGTLGHWLRVSSRDGIVEGFDDEDMDLLSFDRSIIPAEEPTVTRTSIILDYAEELFNRREFVGHGGSIVEGWELSIAVLARLGVKHKTSSKKEIRKVLKRLPLASDAQIDKILHMCNDYDMPEDGRKIVEVRSYPRLYWSKMLTVSSDMPALSWMIRTITELLSFTSLGHIAARRLRMYSTSWFPTPSFSPPPTLTQHLWTPIFIPSSSLLKKALSTSHS